MSVLKANSDGIVTHSHSFYFIFSVNQKKQSSWHKVCGCKLTTISETKKKNKRKEE